jgi:transposase InsO family protein
MIYELVDQRQQKASVAQVCRLLNVSRSGYYAARLRSKSPPVCAAMIYLNAEFAASEYSYRSRRLVTALQARNIVIGHYRVRCLMRAANIKAVWKRKLVNATDSRHDLPVAENVLNRQFHPPESNPAWTSDITYIRTRAGGLYLAVVIDLYSRQVVG